MLNKDLIGCLQICHNLFITLMNFLNKKLKINYRNDHIQSFFFYVVYTFCLDSKFLGSIFKIIFEIMLYWTV